MGLPRLGGNAGSNAIGAIMSPIAGVAGMFADAAMSELGPEARSLTSLVGGIGGAVADLLTPSDKIKPINLKKPAGKSAPKKAQQPKTNKPSNNNSVPNLNKQLLMFNGTLNKIFSKLDDSNRKLDMLSSIHTELRTLTSVTAKVWDVSKKQLSDTRAYQKKMSETRRKSRFDAQVSGTDNNTLDEVLRNKNRFVVPNANITPAKSELGGILSGIPDIVKDVAPNVGIGAGLYAAVKGLLKKGGAKAAKVGAGVAGAGKGLIGGAAGAAGAAASLPAIYMLGETAFGAGKETFNALGNIKIDDIKSIRDTVADKYSTSGIGAAAMALLGNPKTTEIVGNIATAPFIGAGKGMAEGTKGLFSFADMIAPGAGIKKTYEDATQFIGQGVAGAVNIWDNWKNPIKPNIAQQIHDNQLKLEANPIPATGNQKSNNTNIVDNSQKTNNITMFNSNQEKDNSWKIFPFFGM